MRSVPAPFSVCGRVHRKGGGAERLTDFSEALVFVDAAVEGDGSVGGLLQQGERRVGGVSVLLDGLQEQRVAGDPLNRHHQEEAQGGGVDFRAGSTNMIHVMLRRSMSRSARAKHSRRALDDGHDLPPQRLLLFVAVLQNRDVSVVGQVFLIGSFNVRGESEERLAWKERRFLQS